MQQKVGLTREVYINASTNYLHEKSIHHRKAVLVEQRKIKLGHKTS